MTSVRKAVQKSMSALGLKLRLAAMWAVVRRRDLHDQTHPVSDNGEFANLKAGYIASRSRKTLDETAAYWIDEK
jgi:hypothetical protein